MTVSIAAIGGLSIDTIVGTDGEQATRLFGGNAAYGAWGASLWLEPGASHLIGRVGEDFPRDWLAAAASFGVDVGGVEVASGVANPVWQMAYSDGDHRTDLSLGDQDRVGQPTTEALREPYAGELEPTLTGREPVLTLVDGVHCGPVQPMVLLANLARLADRGLIVLVDPGEESALWSDVVADEVLAQSDIFCPSQDDLGLAGSSDPADAAIALARRGPETVVVKLGPAGSLVCSAGTTTHIPALSATVVDPTGAGDSFCGAFVAAFAAFGDPLAAAVMASATASVAVEHRGLLGCLATDPDDVRQRARHLADAVAIALPALA